MPLSYSQWFNQNMGHMVGSKNIGHVQQQWRAYQKRNAPKPPPAPAPPPPPAPAPAPAPAGGVPGSGIDMDKIRQMLVSNQDQFLKDQNAMIDRGANKAVEQGASNLIGSGLAGTSVVGGMTAGVQRNATQAKSNLASRTQMNTDDLLLRYMQLGQGASEGAANRAFQSSENAANRGFQSSQNTANQAFQSGENTANRAFTTQQSGLNRAATAVQGLNNAAAVAPTDQFGNTGNSMIVSRSFAPQARLAASNAAAPRFANNAARLAAGKAARSKKKGNPWSDPGGELG